MNNEKSIFPQIVTNDEIKEKLDNKRIKLVDVREEHEYVLQHIPSSIFLPLSELETRYTELDKDDEIYVICRTGNRSDMAMRFLQSKGFKKVANDLTVMIEWDGPVQP